MRGVIVPFDNVGTKQMYFIAIECRIYVVDNWRENSHQINSQIRHVQNTIDVMMNIRTNTYYHSYHQEILQPEILAHEL